MTASKWQCPACQAAATARTHLDHARDQLVNVALEHTSRP